MTYLEAVTEDVIDAFLRAERAVIGTRTTYETLDARSQLVVRERAEAFVAAQDAFAAVRARANAVERAVAQVMGSLDDWLTPEQQIAMEQAASLAIGEYQLALAQQYQEIVRAAAHRQAVV